MSIEMSPGEVFDRYTILRMKSEHLPDDKKLLAEAMRFHEEVRSIIEGCDSTVGHESFTLTGILLDIMEANAKIWVLESAIREPVNGELADSEVGRRALQIREHNRKRVIAKMKIDNLMGFVPDIKVDHASE